MSLARTEHSIAQCSRFAIVSDACVGWIDIIGRELGLCKEAEREISPNTGIVVQKIAKRSHVVKNSVVIELLVVTRVILTSKLCHPGLILREGGSETLYERNGIAEVCAVNMSGYSKYRAASLFDLCDELLDPIEAIRRVCGCSCDKLISLVRKRLEVLEPYSNSIPDGHIGLSTLIRLIDEHDRAGRKGFDIAYTPREVGRTPTHREVSKTT